MSDLRPRPWTRKIRLGMATAMAVAFGVAVMPLAHATPITFYNDASGPTAERFTLGCGSTNGDCAGLLEALVSDSPTTYDSTDPLLGSLFDLPNAGIATETAFVNANTVGGDSFATGTKDESGNTIFATSAEYFLIKTGKGPSWGLVHNLSGGSLTLYYTPVAGTGSGLSHITEFGTTSVTVPEPATLGMFGMGALLIGLFLGLRRRCG